MFSSAFIVKFSAGVVMKFSTVFVIFAVFASTARAAPSESFYAAIDRIIGSKLLIETKNYHYLTPKLADTSLDLYRGLNLNSFKIGNSKLSHYFMVGVNLKIKEIADDVASIASRVESAADLVEAFHFGSTRVDYYVKRDYIKRLCKDTLATTNDVLGLIDETKRMLGRGVSPNTMRIVQWYMMSIEDVIKLGGFEVMRKVMLRELDTERADVATIKGKIQAARETVDVISNMVDSTLVDNQNMSEQDLRNG